MVEKTSFRVVGTAKTARLPESESARATWTICAYSSPNVCNPDIGERGGKGGKKREREENEEEEEEENMFLSIHFLGAEKYRVSCQSVSSADRLTGNIRKGVVQELGD